MRIGGLGPVTRLAAAVFVVVLVGACGPEGRSIVAAPTTVATSSTTSAPPTTTTTTTRATTTTSTFGTTTSVARTTSTAPVVTTTSPPPATTAAPAPTAVAANCPNGSYVNVDGNRVCSPYASATPPAGATAQCVDGTYSMSQHRQGTCSGHGGVARWLT